VKADGSFTIPNVAPAHYELSVYGFPDDYYIKSAALGGKDILETASLTLRAQAAPSRLCWPHRRASRRRRLNVDQQPATEASVVAVPDEPRRSQLRFHKEDHTDQYGRFTIKGIAPGRYKLFAWEDVEEGAYQDPEFIKKI